jgi:hypothetical protein
VTKPPDFLPALLNLDGTWTEILDRLYTVFTRDFKSGPITHQGIVVIHDRRILPDGQGKEEGFWHVISSWDSSSRYREIDYRRAERLPWARPLMESPPRCEILVFDYNEGPKDKGIRRYIWLEKFDYVLIFQKRNKAFYWITAFFVDGAGKRKDLRRKFEERIQ